MSDGWVGEMRIFPYAKIPKGWHLCDGTLLNIRSNTVLFSLIGTQYGGDGTTTFALPDLRGRVPLHRNLTDPSCAKLGQTGGAEAVTLTTQQLPQHNHTVSAFSATGQIANPADNIPAAVPASAAPGAPPPPLVYGTPTATSLVTLNPGSLLATGTGQAHENRQPTMALQWCICTTGSYPQRES